MIAIGSSYRSLLRQAAGFLASKKQAIVLASTRMAADEIVRLGVPVSIGMHRHSLRDLIWKLSEQPLNERGLQPIRRVAREALCAVIAAKAKLDYLRPVAGFPGFPRALARTLDRLRLSGVGPEGLQDRPDLAVLLGLYEQELKDRRLADHAMRIELASQSMDWCRMPLLVFDVRTKNPAEEQFLRLLIRCASESLRLELSPEHRIASLDMFSASGEALECVEIARRVLRLAGEGVKFDQMAVLMRDPARYQPLIEEAFARASVPVFFSQGTRRPDVAGRAFLSLLRCAEEGLSASRFAEYLSLSETRVPPKWERLIVDSAVIGGRERWEKRLAGKAAEFETKGLDTKWIEELQAFALPLIQRLDELPRTALWSEWLERLDSFTEDETVRDLLDELAPMGEIGPVPLSEVLRVLGPELPVRRTEPDDVRYGKVFAGSIEEAQGLDFWTVFVPGLNEGVFPKTPREDPLLIGFAPPEDDQPLLRIATACAGERLVASYSMLDLATGRERVPSFYAFEIAKAAGTDLATESVPAEARLGHLAPKDPAHAIDAAEYDLAYLRLKAEEPPAGQASYLKSVNPHVYRALTARAWRWKKQWKWSDGLVAPDEVETGVLLEKYRPSKHAYSPTQLEQFARCPYRFLLRAVYRLHPAERPEVLQRIDPAMRGEIYHRIQYELLKTKGGIDEVSERVIAEEMEHYVPAIPHIWRAAADKIVRDLRGWERVRETEDAEWTPEEFEWEFNDVPVLGDVLLNGRIDLVERHASGVLRVTDHKTGKPPKEEPRFVGGGESLQPVLYALAVEKEKGSPVTQAQLFYATIRQNYKRTSIQVGPAARESAAQVLAAIDKALHDGFLPAAPKKDGCENCEYLPVCGPYEEERTARKEKKPLVALSEVRKLS